MRYTLIITNHEARKVVELSYDLWSAVREMAGTLINGVAETFTYNVQIYDNQEKRVIFNENTY
jgi:hypothetical protein